VAENPNELWARIQNRVNKVAHYHQLTYAMFLYATLRMLFTYL
jgi:hypothetical protein